ncbi:hypothetical protein ACH4C2_10525 [Streptomyces sp. NPDC018057]|uniref:hypothetical protein n=1 Tax=unclassified Streptomyces TaxID=2593676 RepID=UPI0037A15116
MNMIKRFRLSAQKRSGKDDQGLRSGDPRPHERILRAIAAVVAKAVVEYLLRWLSSLL